VSPSPADSHGPKPVSRRRAACLVGGAAVGGGWLLSGCSGGDGAARAPARPWRAVGSEGPGEAAVSSAPPGSQARPRPPASEPLVRVRTDRVVDGRVEFGDAGRRIWMTAPGTQFTAMVTGPVRCQREKDGWSVRSTSRGRTVSRSIQDPGALTLSAFDARDQGLTFRSRRLAGTVHLQPAGESEIDVVCHLPMEQYLPGVLGGELFESWRDATHESLAVAARSFALCERFHWLGRRGFDVVADERSQVWIGATAPARSRRAVQATRGELLLWGGLVVPAYYCAACGGRPAEATLAISPNPVNAIPPLVIPSPDQRPACGCRTLGSHGSWSLSIASKDVVDAVRQWASRGGDRSMATARWPMRFDVISVQASGRPERIRMTSPSTQAAVELSAVEVQRILNLTGRGRPLRSADVTLEVTSAELRVTGAGFGHGVGLCQYGAESMARAGANRTAILTRYYPSATIQRAWS
jgi:stage II sporulation protein D